MIITRFYVKEKKKSFSFHRKSANVHFTNRRVRVEWLVKRFTLTLPTVEWLFCGFDRFWKSKWTGENRHFSNSEWASASRFIYYLKIDHLSIVCAFCAVFAHLLFENRPLAALDTWFARKGYILRSFRAFTIRKSTIGRFSNRKLRRSAMFIDFLDVQPRKIWKIHEKHEEKARIATA